MDRVYSALNINPDVSKLRVLREGGYLIHSEQLMMVGSLFETEPAVTTRLRARLVQIDVNLGMA